MNDDQRARQVIRTLIDRRKHLAQLRAQKVEEEPVEGPVDPDPSVRSVNGFHAFAWPQALLSQGQNFQDLWVLYELGRPETGYFVEFGVANGSTFSNSYMMERRLEWTGVISEPNPGFHERINKIRHCHFTPKAVHARTGEKLVFSCAARPMFSRLETPGLTEDLTHDVEVEEQIEVETISLNDLLDDVEAPAVVDYISMDTEGSELEIIEAFDFSKRHVKAFTIEHNFTPAREKIFDVMSANGYVRRFPELSRYDDWYLHESVLTA